MRDVACLIILYKVLLLNGVSIIVISEAGRQQTDTFFLQENQDCNTSVMCWFVFAESGLVDAPNTKAFVFLINILSLLSRLAGGTALVSSPTRQISNLHHMGKI